MLKNHFAAHHSATIPSKNRPVIHRPVALPFNLSADIRPVILPFSPLQIRCWAFNVGCSTLPL